MNQIKDVLDRSSVKDAEAVLSAICPDQTMRQEMLRCLLDSIARAEEVAPDAWAVTLFDNGFRLNFGQVEALTFEKAEARWPFATSKGDGWPFAAPDEGQPIVRILTQGALPGSVLEQQQTADSMLQVSSAAYKSVALPQHIVALAVEAPGQVEHWMGILSQAHQRFIVQALHTPTGRVRSSTAFRRTHSPGLVEYAKLLCTKSAVSPVTPSPEEDALEDAEQSEYFEGRPIAVQTTRYERDRHARLASLAHHGYSCAACGFNFGAVYGPVAAHYIQVHHLNPVASHGATAAVNPITDMRPLCANCHAVAHFKNPPYTLEEIIQFMNRR